MHGLDLRATHDEVPCSLDVDNQVIVLDLADGADLLTTILEEHLVADADCNVVSHGLPLVRVYPCLVGCKRTATPNGCLDERSQCAEPGRADHRRQNHVLAHGFS